MVDEFQHPSAKAFFDTDTRWDILEKWSDKITNRLNNLGTCVICGAVVAVQTEKMHVEWHDSLQNTTVSANRSLPFSIGNL